MLPMCSQRLQTWIALQPELRPVRCNLTLKLELVETAVLNAGGRAAIWPVLLSVERWALGRMNCDSSSCYKLQKEGATMVIGAALAHNPI
jgi:hypothetical protein